MPTNYRKEFEGLGIIARTTTAADTKGELEVISGTGKIQYHNGTSVSPLVTEAHTATLTNKSMDGAANTFTNLPGAAVTGTVAVSNGGTGVSTLTSNGVVIGNGTSGVTITAEGATGTVLHGNTGADPSFSQIVNADISASAAIDFSKFAALTSANILVGNASNIATSVAVTGDVTISNTGVTAIGSAKVTNAMLAGSIDLTTKVTGALPIANGGTGQTTANAGFNALSPMTTGGDLIFGGASGVGTRLANGTAGQILQSNGTTTAPTWVAAPSGSPLTTKGDIYGFSTVNARIPVGTDTQVLTADSTQALGVKWASAPTGAFNIATLDTSFLSTKGTNANAELTVGDWLAYADAAGTSPVDMTGGSPNTTIARNTTTPLDGVADFKVTVTTGATRQGEGVSLVVNIPPAYRGQTLSYTFPYATTGTISTDDFKLYAYDITNSVVITPFVANGITSSSGIANAIFQTSANTASIRVGIHIARATNTGAVTINFDDVQVVPAVAIQGVGASDWVAYTPTLTSFGTATNVSAFWRRVGDTLQVRGSHTSGTVASALGSISLPSGLAIDTAKIDLNATTSNPGEQIGYIIGGTSATRFGPLVVSTSTSTSLVYFGKITAQAAMLTPGNVDAGLGSTEVQSYFFSVPISGWSASNSGVTTAPRSEVTVTEGNGHGSTNTKIRRFSNTQLNTGSAITYADSATLGGSFTVNESGVYAISYSDYKNTSFVIFGISVNTSAPTTSITSLTYAQGYRGQIRLGVGDTSPNFSTVLALNSGDVVRAHDDGNLTGTSTSEPTIFNITKVNDVALFNGSGANSPRSEVWVYTANGYGSTNTKILRYTTTGKNTGSAITYADSSTAGASFTINETGVYSVSTGNQYSGDGNYGVSLNSSQLTTGIGSITRADCLMEIRQITTNMGAVLATTLNLVAGDVIRPHGDATSVGSDTYTNFFRVTKVSN